MTFKMLGDVCTFENGDRGKNYPSKGSFVSEGIPFINAGNLKNSLIDTSSLQFISTERFNLLSNGKVKENDILFCLRGSLGKFAIVKGIKTGAIASSLIIIRVKPDLDLGYLKNYLKSPLCSQEITRFENGAAQPNLSAKDLKQFAIPLPPLAEQKQIAAILDAADSLRQKDQQLVEHYTALSQSLFLEMFGDPVSNPMGWENVIWQDVLTIKNGKNQKKVANPNGLYPIYGSGGVMGYADEYLCEAGTTVIGRKGSINKPIYVAEKFWNVDTAFGLCAGDTLNNMFLYYFCTRYNFLKHNKATTLPSLTKADLLKVEMPFPPLELQNQFAERVAIIEQQKRQAQTNLENSEALFNSLLQRAFTGELTANKAA